MSLHQLCKHGEFITIGESRMSDQRLNRKKKANTMKAFHSSYLQIYIRNLEPKFGTNVSNVPTLSNGVVILWSETNVFGDGKGFVLKRTDFIFFCDLRSFFKSSAEIRVFAICNHHSYVICILYTATGIKHRIAMNKEAFKLR